MQFYFDEFFANSLSSKNIQYSNIHIALFQECVCQVAITAAHINDGCVLSKMQFFNKFNGSIGVRLKPAFLFVSLVDKYLVPVFLIIHKTVIFIY